MIEIAIVLLTLVAMVDILPFEGSTMTLLVIAVIVVIALAILRFLIPLIIAVVIAIVLMILFFGGIPIP